MEENNDESAILEQARESMFRRSISRRYGRGRTSAELNYLI